MRLLPIEGQPTRLAADLTTVAQWNTFLAATDHAWQPSHSFNQSNRHPVVGVNKEDAQAFCSWLTEHERKAGRLTDLQSYRLPSREEWDGAAGLQQADLGRLGALKDGFEWGLQWPPPANTANLQASEIPDYEDPFPFTSPVGSYPPNSQGLHDMAGNAWQWVMDEERRGHGELRGGSWADFNPTVFRLSYRYSAPTNMRVPTVGFRVALEDPLRAEEMLAASRELARLQALDQAAEPRQPASPEENEDLSGVTERTPDPEGEGQTDSDVASPFAGSQPRAGRAWKNSFGTTLIPVEGINPWVAIHEVRVDEFEQFVSDTELDWSGRPGFVQENNHAAAGMTAEEAESFCRWLTEREQEMGLIAPGQFYRLPTDAEWTLMAGGQPETAASPAQRHARDPSADYFDGSWPPPFGSGNFESMRINGYRDRYSFTAPVGSFQPNARQLYDIEGNVAEWVSDRWQPGDSGRVARGGSWKSHRPEEFVISNRRNLSASESSDEIGFRYVLDFGEDH